MEFLWMYLGGVIALSLFFVFCYLIIYRNTKEQLLLRVAIALGWPIVITIKIVSYILYS